MSGNSSVYYSGNNSGSNPGNDSGNNGWKKVFILISAIVVTFILLIICYFYDILYLFELYRPSAIATKLADFLGNYNFFMNAPGGNTGGFDPIRDAVEINEIQRRQAELTHEMHHGYGKDRLGTHDYYLNYDKINSLSECYRNSDIHSKKLIANQARQQLLDSNVPAEIELRTISVIKNSSLSMQNTAIQGLNSRDLEPVENPLRLQKFNDYKIRIGNYVQAYIDTL